MKQLNTNQNGFYKLDLIELITVAGVFTITITSSLSVYFYALVG